MMVSQFRHAYALTLLVLGFSFGLTTPLHAEILFQDDFSTTTLSPDRWDIQIAPTDTLKVVEAPGGSGNYAVVGISPTYSARTAFIARKPFERKQALRATFTWWYEPNPPNSIDFTAINGPWRRTPASEWSKYKFPIAEDLEVGLGRYIQQDAAHEDHQWAEGVADWQPGVKLDPAFNTAIRNATSRAKALRIRIDLGLESGGRGMYSLDNGGYWNPINVANGARMDSSGLAAGASYMPPGGGEPMPVSGSPTVYLGFGVRGASLQYWDDIQVETVTGEDAPTTSPYTLAGLPQQKYSFTATYENGTLEKLNVLGSVGYVIHPKGPVDPEKRWVWIIPMWLGLNSDYGNVLCRNYYEPLLAKGITIVGFDCGTTVGSPAGAELCQQFYEYLMAHYDLNRRARLIAVSNGGLITYGWAWRHPDEVDRIFGIYTALDFRSWPKINLVAGPTAITPKSLAYPFNSVAELEKHITEYNPIDNLEPIAKAGIKLMHIHGDNDTIVPLEPNTLEAKRRIEQYGGTLELHILKGEGHGGMPAFSFKPAIDFLAEPSRP